METRDFLFYGENIKAHKLFKGHLCLLHAIKKNASDLSISPKPIKSKKSGTKGLVAALHRASNQAGPSQCPGRMITAKGGV